MMKIGTFNLLGSFYRYVCLDAKILASGQMKILDIFFVALSPFVDELCYLVKVFGDLAVVNLPIL